jgi:hypothetical protein
MFVLLYLNHYIHSTFKKSTFKKVEQNLFSTFRKSGAKSIFHFYKKWSKIDYWKSAEVWLHLFKGGLVSSAGSAPRLRIVDTGYHRTDQAFGNRNRNLGKAPLSDLQCRSWRCAPVG